MGKLEGQIAIVTGGSRGIGRAIALAFGREGGRVAIIAAHDQAVLHDVEREISLPGVETVGVLADVGRRAEIDRTVKTIPAALIVLFSPAAIITTEI